MDERRRAETKEEIRALERVFGKTHERFQIVATAGGGDELTCQFVGRNEQVYQLKAHLTVTYPDSPPVWVSDTTEESEDAIVTSTIQKLSMTTGSDNRLITQVRILLRELCLGFGLTTTTLPGSGEDMQTQMHNLEILLNECAINSNSGGSISSPSTSTSGSRPGTSGSGCSSSESGFFGKSSSGSSQGQSQSQETASSDDEDIQDDDDEDVGFDTDMEGMGDLGEARYDEDDDCSNSTEGRKAAAALEVVSSTKEILTGTDGRRMAVAVPVGHLDACKPPALASLSYKVDLLAKLDYKNMVLNILCTDSDDETRLMCELRMTLFGAAIVFEECLMPFPSCFFDPVTLTKKFYSVIAHADHIPILDTISESTELPALTWQLLHWVFTNPLTLVPLTTDIRATVADLEVITGLKLPIPDNVSVFMFNIVQGQGQGQPKSSKFLEAKAKCGGSTYFAFHGSPLRNFHSIVHRGLLAALNVRSWYGYGTYMSTDIMESRQYCAGNHVGKSGWENSGFGVEPTCIAICEVVASPEVQTIRNLGNGNKFYVCPNDDLIQLSHLLLIRSPTEELKFN